MTTSMIRTSPAKTIREIMSKPVLTVEIGESLWDAWQLLFVSGLRHLVVLDDNGACIGILSDRNILADVPSTLEHLADRRVRDIIARVPLATTSPDVDPRAAAMVMREQAIEALPVIDNDRLVGIVTESDIVHWVAG
jgi:CBS domain-containing protein